VAGPNSPPFPDWKVTVDDIIAEGDKVVARATGQGTHLGEYMGIPPTGKRIKVSWIAIYRIADGKLAEHWQQIDELGLRQQLGAVLTLPAA
jgi:predicted ester cyclase